MQSPYGGQVVLLGGTAKPVDGFLKVGRGVSVQDDIGLNYGPARRSGGTI